MKSINISNGFWKILYAIAIGSILWLILIVLAPILKSSGNSIAEYFYFLFEPVCHQISERSIFVNSEPMAVCTRCFAIYFGAFLFLSFTIVQKKIYHINPSLMMLFSLPTVIDFIVEKLGLYVDIPFIRFITGLLFGTTIIYLILYSILDIKNENLMKRDIYYGKSEIN